VGHPSAFAGELDDPVAIARTRQVGNQLRHRDDRLGIPGPFLAGELSRADLGQTQSGPKVSFASNEGGGPSPKAGMSISPTPIFVPA